MYNIGKEVSTVCANLFLCNYYFYMDKTENVYDRSVFTSKVRSV